MKYEKKIWRNTVVKKTEKTRLFIFPALLALTVAVVITTIGCGDEKGDKTSQGGGESGKVKVDGSSTVGPLTEAVAELFRESSPDVRVSVGISGTGGGFEKFCAGETDISDASRPIKPDEKELCKKAGIRYEELLVANDGITIALNSRNDFAKCLSVSQLNRVWNTGSKIGNWRQIDKSFPDSKLALYGAGTDSGTFDFFTEAINGEEGASRSDYTASEDDNILVKGIEGDEGAMGYFGYSYFAQNSDRLKSAQVKDGSGKCIKPTVETIQSGAYKPLSRPLFIYISSKALKGNSAVESFITFYLGNVGQASENAGLVPLTGKQKEESKAKFNSFIG